MSERNKARPPHIHVFDRYTGVCSCGTSRVAGTALSSPNAGHEVRGFGGRLIGHTMGDGPQLRDPLARDGKVRA